MKIAVLVKSVPDTAATPEIGDDGRTVITDHLDFILNPYDEFAVEEAVRLKESLGAEVTAVSLGGENALKAVRSALALGIEAGVLVRPPSGAELTGRGAALCLAGLLRELAPDLVLAGKHAVDDDGAQVAERVAEQLGFGHASAVSRMELNGNRLVADQEMEGGHLTFDMALPAVVTTEKGINTPRYPTLPQILKARRKEVREVQVPEGGADLEPGWVVEGVTAPNTERRRQIFTEEESAAVECLADLLRQEFAS
ncbi:MAG: electron transfer flavoprotein subunit beta [Desulfuromonas sp.]|uniref:electron transfer flavoprotein subunit beta/FixA family protein n=1 Tax=Desulfuromonas sp. TaxID=892 RepID=UPI000CC8D247|nr:electron transfer flavoprotein subunit beta/FixA family protein [Desulfuromonas sp.]PLX82009.1 MAG: electron transfer flavoprotein subunit beta [Desulfuromonas sp.]